MKEPNAKKNACWVFETVRIILIFDNNKFDLFYRAGLRFESV